MSFRKRNTIIRAPGVSSPSRIDRTLLPGTRPSPLDGRLITSTGTASLDQLLAGHSGMPLGSSLLIEESGTTDFGGILLRYFASEGLVQGHHVHVLGFGNDWRRELPGLVEAKDKTNQHAERSGSNKMKIAWRYEGLKKGPEPTGQVVSAESSSSFCHSFDLSQRLAASSIRGQFFTYSLREVASRQPHSIFSDFVMDLQTKLKSSPSSVHRVIVPSLLSPALYPPTVCKPQDVLQFLHSLQSMLRQFPSRLTALISLPTSLHPRNTGLCKWMELFFDGVIELDPLRQLRHRTGSLDEGSIKAQGLVRVHTMPVFHEKGGGLEGCWKREDMSFRLSASGGLLITPFSLPPVGLNEPSTSSTQPQVQDLEF